MAWSYKDFEKGKETNSWDTKRQETEQAIANLGDFKYNTYKPSDAVNNYQSQLQNHEANKVGDWTGGAYGFALKDILDKYNNREKFSYDLNGDALYQQYKDQYMTQGNMAMMDTMGQASAATGGYGNSYAQSVGQQTYQGYLQQLNDRVPELYQMALSKYNMEGDQLLNQYNITSDAYNKEYGQYRDSVADWQNERSYLQSALNSERTWDYGQFSDAEDRRLKEYDIAYGKLQDSLNRADTNYWNSYNQDYGMYSDDRNLSHTNYWNETNLAYQKEQDAIANQLARDQLNETIRANKAAEAARASSGSSGGGGGSDKTSLFGGFTEAQFTDKMASAFDSGNKTYAQSLVAASGYTDAAWQIYNMYFGEKTPDTSNWVTVGKTKSSRDKKLDLMEKKTKSGQIR